MLKKPKVHLMLHLVECMKEFGPTSAFNSERYADSLLFLCLKILKTDFADVRPSTPSSGCKMFTEIKGLPVVT